MSNTHENISKCIESPYACNNSGYPIKWFEGKNYYHHRLVAGAGTGEVVMHTCDNKKCINPEHLKIGTYAENSADMVTKNRQAFGERAGNSKLVVHQVIEIRGLFGKLSSRKVAKLFNISASNVKDIWTRKIWRHI